MANIDYFPALQAAEEVYIWFMVDFTADFTAAHTRDLTADLERLRRQVDEAWESGGRGGAVTGPHLTD